MTAVRIFATARPTDTGAPIHPMDPTDAMAWEITRQRHPELYGWRQVITEAREAGEPPFIAGVLVTSSAILVIAGFFAMFGG